MIRVLLIDDDARLFELLSGYLGQHGVALEHARDGQRGLRALGDGSYDAILLDGMMPGLDGLEVLARIRERSTIPVLMLTARGDESDRVVGLELGADDYMPKPFSARELLARIRSIIRRARGQAGPKLKMIEIGSLSLDPGTRTAHLAGAALDLTSYEFSLLYALGQHAGRALSRERLMELARGNAEEAFDRSIDVHISRLRNKLGDTPRKPTWIRTVRGVGYQLLRPTDRR